MASKNDNLHKAKRAKDDEFFTIYEDIEKELVNYQDGQLRDKWIYCPCDDWNKSNFPKYFKDNFDKIGLKRLTCSCWNPDGGSSKIWDYDGKSLVECNLKENGDFRSVECTKIKDMCDIVITNPPFSCYSVDTEVFTSSGWKYIKDVDISVDNIYSLNPETNEMEFVRAVDFICSPVNGKLYNYKSHNMDFLVTGNHKMFTYMKDSILKGKYKGLVDADSIKPSYLLKLTGFNWNCGNKCKYFILPSTTQKEQYTRKEIFVEDKRIDMGDWLEFFGFWLADGCVRLGLNSQGNQRYDVCIKQNKKNEEYVKKLFRGIGFDCKVGSDRISKNINYSVYSKQLWEYLKPFGKSYDKYIPSDFLNLDKSLLQRLFTGYVNGDCTHCNGNLVLSTVSKRLIDNLQELVLKLFGQISKVRAVNTTYNNKPYVYYKIFLQPDMKHRSYAKYGKPSVVDYNDNVYCLTLERNHIMLVRRNETIGWCGNCFRDFIYWLNGGTFKKDSEGNYVRNET